MARRCAFVGLLLALAMADVFSAEMREWWADRPMFAAVVAGSLLLGLTVLLVDAIVERARAREVRQALAHPVVHLLDVAGSGDLHAARESIAAVPFLDPPLGEAWTTLPAIEDALAALERAAQSVATTVDQLRGEFLAGGSELYGVYERALKCSASARRAMSAVSDYRTNVDPSDTLLLLVRHPKSDDVRRRAEYVEWLWNEVGRAYNGLVTALHQLKVTAEADLGEELKLVRGAVAVSGHYSGLAIADPFEPGMFIDNSAYMYTVRRGERASASRPD